MLGPLLGTTGGGGVSYEADTTVLDVTLDDATTNFDVTALTGYTTSLQNIEIRLAGTLGINTTITFPPVSSTKKRILVIDVTGNGLTSPDYTLLMQPDGSDSMTSSDGILTDQYDIDQDYETALFQSNEDLTKWEAI